MKFTCQRDTILKEIEYANNFTSQRNSLSVLSNVLLENYQNKLTITGSDSKLSFKSTIPVITEVPGSTTVTCDKFLSILKSLPSADIDFNEENEKLNISPKGDKKIKFNIRTIEAEAFGEVSFAKDVEFFSLSQRDFFDMIEKTSFAVGVKEAKFAVTGVFIEKKEDYLVMVATDGKRLSLSRKMFEQEIPDFPPAIIPPKFLQMLQMIGEGEGVLLLSINENTICANVNGRIISSNLIIAKYPNYEKVIPPEFAYECKVKTADMLEALNRVSLFVEQNSKKIFLDIESNGIMVTGENMEMGDATEIVPCEYSGEPTKISFNYNFLQSPLKRIDSENFKICFNNNTAALEVIPEPERDYVFIIMPMHV